MIYTKTRNGNPVDAAGQEFFVGDYIAYKASTRANAISCGVITDITDASEKNIKVEESLVLQDDAVSLQNLRKSQELRPICSSRSMTSTRNLEKKSLTLLTAILTLATL
jgi:predicted homoserine dehydrogenase-like protein